MSSPLDGLAVARVTAIPPPRRRATRTVALIVVCACAGLAWLLRDRFIPALPVTVTAVVARSDVAPTGGSQAIVARASGWLHPDPHPITVSTQRRGTLRAVHVRSGQNVAVGDVIAELDPRDADLALQRAEILAVTAQSAIRGAEASLVRLAAELEAAEARVALAEDRHLRLERAGSAATDFDRSQAMHTVSISDAERRAAAAAVTEAEAALLSARSLAEAARNEVALAQLDRDRCTVIAPAAGIVLRVHAVPGQHLSLEDGSSARIADLFDPGAVQVRADVPLSEAGQVHPGQTADIEFETLPGHVLTGRVTALAGEADAARNTLQAHIALDAAPAGLRPDMLARVRIRGAAMATTPTAAQQLILAPIRALHARTETDADVWVVDADGRLHRRRVAIAGPEQAGWVPIAEGLRLGDLVVVSAVEDLREGRRAAPTFPEGKQP